MNSVIDGVKFINDTMLTYGKQFKRIPMRDVAIWQSLVHYYDHADEFEIIVTSTASEAFERMVADGWSVDMGDYFSGIDYQIVDEEVLEYLIKNSLAQRMDELDLEDAN